MKDEQSDIVSLDAAKLSEIELSNEEDFVKIEKIKDPDNLLVASRDDTYELTTKKRLLCGPGSVTVAVFNLCSVALGPSSLSLPYAFSLTGLTLATLVSIFAFICTVITSNMIIKVRLLTMTRSFEEAIKSICGKWGIVLYNFFMFCILYGACVAYLIGVGDLMFPIYHNTEIHIAWWLNRKAMMIIFFVVLVLPLSWKDNSNSLAITSMLSFVGCFVFTFLLIVWCFYDNFATHIEQVSIWKMNDRFIESTSIILFSFIFQMNIYEIHSELTIPTEDAMKRVNFFSALSCCIIYILTGIAGYIAFPHTVEGNIISTWLVPSKPIIMSIVVGIAYVGMAFTVIFSFPLNVLPLRYTIQLIIFGQKDNVDDKLHRKIYLCNKISTLVICISSLLIALFFEQIEIVFNLIGGLPSGFIGYALPSYCILVLYHRKYTGISKFYLISAVIIMILGTVIGVYSFIDSIIGFFS